MSRSTFLRPHFQKLHLVQLPISPARDLQQFPVRPKFFYFPFFQNQYFIGMADGR